MKTCKEFCDHLSDYLDGEIGEHECKLIEDHLQVCPPCSLMYQSLKTTVDVCEKGISEDMPEAVKTRLKMFLRRHCESDRTLIREE
jgi:predicted anti-sigma-YlaC factor YlaD